ncbi:MAG: glycosyltransferase family 9 protein [Pyrinomonadaceae bacterium]
MTPLNILVIDFGQLGDVVLSLPALAAIRNKFPRARITVAVGKPGAAVVELSACANEVIVVDRVGLRDGPKLLSIARLITLTREVRSRRFDLVIDLHSLTETNLLGYFSGASSRLFARRPGRSLDFLASPHLRPPIEDRSKHAIDRYLDVLKPFDIHDTWRVPRLKSRPEDDHAIEKILVKENLLSGDTLLVGLNPGAGHESRRWPLARFGELAERLRRNDNVRVLIFAGPEERALVHEMRSVFGKSAIILDKLTIPQLAAAQARLAVFVSNDTGPMHIAAAVGTPVVLLLDNRAPDAYLPLGNSHRIVRRGTISDLTTAEVYEATRTILVAGRTAALFESRG